jgi:HEAT repeat protein
MGPVPPAERAADLRDDRIRLLGVDRAPKVQLDVPFYDIPGNALGAAFDAVFISPSIRLYMIFTGDTPATAARQMLDEQSADARRHGILRLAQEQYARQGEPENELWADMARRDKDYTVRAAAIRALNWARDPHHTQIFIDALTDEHPLVRLEAAKALANIPDPNAITPLLSRLQNDVSRDVRIASADALRCYKTDEVAHALITTLPESDFDVAWQSRQSLRLMTAYDFGYDEQAWIRYLAENPKPFE